MGRRVRLRRARCCRTISRPSRATPKATSSTAPCSASTCRARRPRRRCGSKEEQTATPAAELTWRAADESDPEEIQVRFDGEPLAVIEGRRDRTAASTTAGRCTCSSAELIFRESGARPQSRSRSAASTARRSRPSSPRCRSSSTAGTTLPSAAEVESWLRIGDQPARVVAVERGPREVVLVRDDASHGDAAQPGPPGLRQRPSPQPVCDAAHERRPRTSRTPCAWSDTHPMLVPVKGGGVRDALPAVAERRTAPPRGLRLDADQPVLPARRAKRSRSGWPRRSPSPGCARWRAIGCERWSWCARREAAAAARRVASIPPTCAASWPRCGCRSSTGRSARRATSAPRCLGRAEGGPRVGRRPRSRSTSLIEALRPQFLVWVEGLHKPDDVDCSRRGRRPGCACAGAVDCRDQRRRYSSVPSSQSCRGGVKTSIPRVSSSASAL